MQWFADRVAPVVAWTGAPLVAYVLLAPAVWSRDDIDGLVLFAAFGLGNGLLAVLRSRGTLPWPIGLRMLFGGAACLVAFSIVLDVVLGGAPVETWAQRTVVAVSVVVVAAGVRTLVGESRGRFAPRPDPERDARRAAIREDVRREIAEIERRARQPER